MEKFSLPNVLSGSRLVLAGPSCYLVAEGQWLLEALVIVLAVGSDVLDGYLARKHEQTSTFGGLLDHASDAVFVTATMVGLVLAGFVPWLLPPLIIAAFGQYMLDSSALSGEPLRASIIGRYNGIAYFVLAGFPSMQYALALHPVPDTWFYWAGWVLIVTTILSMTDRLVALIRLRLR